MPPAFCISNICAATFFQSSGSFSFASLAGDAGLVRGESGELTELRAAMAFCKTALSRSRVEIDWRCEPSQAPAMASARTGGMNNLVFNTRRISVAGPRCQ